MKLTKLILCADIPQKKCGTEGIVAALISGGFGLINSAGQSATNAYNVHAAQDENKKNRDFQSSENEKQRSWASDFWREQFRSQSEEWYKQQATQFQDQWQQYRLQSALAHQYWQEQQDYSQGIWQQQQEYYSPAEQVARYSAAGLNPSAFMGGQQATGGLSSAPVSTPSTASYSHSAPSPSTPSTSMVGSGGSGLPQAINPVASIIGTLTQLSEAAERSAHSKEMWEMIKPKIENLMANSATQKAYKEGLELDNIFKDKSMPDRLSKVWNELKEIETRTAMEFAIKGFYDESAVTKAEEKFLMVSQEYLNDANASYACTMASTWVEDRKAERDMWRAKAQEARSQSALNRALAKTENELREGRIRALDLSNGIQEIVKGMESVKSNILTETQQAQITKIVEESKRAGLINEQQAAEIDRLKRENKWIEVKNAIGCIGEVAGAIGAIGNPIVGALSTVQRTKCQKQFNDSYGRFVESYGNSIDKQPDRSQPTKMYGGSGIGFNAIYNQ